jgi:hypothetical protein
MRIRETWEKWAKENVPGLTHRDREYSRLQHAHADGFTEGEKYAKEMAAEKEAK